MPRPTTPTFTVRLLLAAVMISAAMLLAAVELSAQEVDPSRPITLGDAARLASSHVL